MLNLLVLAAGGLLAFLAMPHEGWFGAGGLLAPLFLLPVYWFTLRHRPLVSAAGGAFWISLVTLLSQNWLLSFHPGAFPLVLLFQIPWYAGAFAASSFLWRRFPRSGPWFQAAAWTVFEFVRTQGFFAYPFGSLASAAWEWPLVFQSADLVGTSGITFLLAWTSAWLAALLNGKTPWSRLRLDLGVGLALWALNLGYGAWKLGEAESGPSWRPALIQQSQDPWQEGASAYEAAFDHLEALSKEALLARPDAVIWSETAFVPSVDYHNRYHENPSSLRLVRRLEALLGQQSVPFLIGNDHREKSAEGIKDFNAVLSWDGGWKDRYSKVRLVPFTESFPFREALPWVYDWLKAADTHFWEPGTRRNLLTIGGVPVGTPVCFEDAFPDAAREFAAAGALALVNLTNDSWAPGTANRMQHLSLAVFRSVETRLPLLRAGNDGATASISAKGELLRLLPVGPPGVLQAEVRLVPRAPTLYTRGGDWLPFVLAAVLLGALIAARRKDSVVDKGPEL